METSAGRLPDKVSSALGYYVFNAIAGLFSGEALRLAHRPRGNRRGSSSGRHLPEGLRGIRPADPHLLRYRFIIILHKGVLGAAIGSCISIVFVLNGVWLMATASGLASGILTLVLAKTMKLQNATIV